MRHPRTIVPVGCFAFFIGAHLVHGHLIRLRIALVRTVFRHPTHGVHFPTVTRLDDQFAVRTHEVRGHGYAPAVREYRGRIVREFLDEAEDVIPTSAIQAGRV